VAVAGEIPEAFRLARGVNVPAQEFLHATPLAAAILAGLWVARTGIVCMVKEGLQSSDRRFVGWLTIAVISLFLTIGVLSTFLPKS